MGEPLRRPTERERIEAKIDALTGEGGHRPDCECADCFKMMRNGYAPQDRPREITVAGMWVVVTDPEAGDGDS